MSYIWGETERRSKDFNQGNKPICFCLFFVSICII